MLALRGARGEHLKSRTRGQGAIVDDAAGLRALLALIYKRLGTMVSVDGKLAPAVAQCVAKYRNARAPIGRALRHSKRVPDKRRLLHLDAIATTHLYYCVDTWPEMPQRQQRRLAGARVLGYRMSL